MSECTEHLGDPLASKGPGLNQQDSPGGGRSACNSTGGIEQEGGGGGEEGEGRLPGIPEPTHHLPIPGFPFLSRHWETWRGCPGLPGSFSGQSAFGKKNAGFCWGGGVLLPSGLQKRDPQDTVGGPGTPRLLRPVSPIL